MICADGSVTVLRYTLTRRLAIFIRRIDCIAVAIPSDFHLTKRFFHIFFHDKIDTFDIFNNIFIFYLV